MMEISASSTVWFASHKVHLEKALVKTCMPMFQVLDKIKSSSDFKHDPVGLNSITSEISR